MRFLLPLCAAFTLTNALVDFANSALYDIYDFKGVDEVHLTKCDFGCLIYAATTTNFVQYPEGLDPYAMNLIIFDNDNQENQMSIAKLSQNRDNKQRKLPLTITGNKNISVVNQNDPNEKTFWTIALFVIEKSKASEIIDYEVYDPAYVQNTTFTPSAGIVTFLSAFPFTISSPALNNQKNSVTVRLAGFENALENNKDGCPFVYKTADAASFPGFSIASNPQILSLVFGTRGALSIHVEYTLSLNTITDIGVSGFITSPGWNGCSKPNNGGFQSFQSRDDIPDDVYILSKNENDFNVSIDVLPNFDDKHELEISEHSTFTNPTVVPGTKGNQHFDFTNTNYLQIAFQNMKGGDQGFILKYTSTLVPKGATTDSSIVGSSTPTSPTTSPTQSPSTTSAGFRATGFLLPLLLVSLLL